MFFPVLYLLLLAPMTPLRSVLEILLLEARLIGETVVDEGCELQRGLGRRPANLPMAPKLVRAHREIRGRAIGFAPTFDASSSAKLSGHLPRLQSAVHPEEL